MDSSRRLALCLLPFLLSVGCTRLLGIDAPPQRHASPEPNRHSYDPRPEVSVEMLASGCFGCHGPQGRSRRDAIPSLAGLSERYFVQVMEAYRYGGRFSTLMGRIAMGYSLEETERLARYFAALEATPVKQRVNWELASKGRQLHRLYCRQCHGDLQQAANHDSVVLNGQWMNYLRWTLHDYLIGINQTDLEMMQQLSALVRRYGDEGIEALVHYYGSEGI